MSAPWKTVTDGDGSLPTIVGADGHCLLGIDERTLPGGSQMHRTPVVRSRALADQIVTALNGTSAAPAAPGETAPDAPPATFTAADISHALRCGVRAWGDDGHWGPCVECLDLWQRARAAGDEDCDALDWEGPDCAPVAPLLSLTPQEQRPHLQERRAAFNATLDPLPEWMTR